MGVTSDNDWPDHSPVRLSFLQALTSTHRPATARPPSYEACKNGHEEVVEFLLSQGADANKTNKDGMLPLHIASKKGNYRSAQAPPTGG